MRLSYAIWSLVLLLLLAPVVQAQNSQGDARKPNAAAPKTLSADVLWYGEAPPGWGGVVTDMKLIVANVGWAERGGRLYWTEDNGTNWTDITPPTPDSGEHIADIFFLDAHHGWVLFAQYGEPEPKFDLAYSDNTGATWTTTRVTLPEHEGILLPSGRVSFADTQNGWMILNVHTSSAFSAGALLVTSDGGRTWRDAPSDPGGQGPILAVTAQEAWMVGDGEDEELQVTRDGGKSWQTVSLPAPKEIYPATDPTADVPVFEDDEHGFVAVTYSGGSGSPSAAVLFATSDGGRTWNPDRILANLEEQSLGHSIPSAVVDSAWITAIENRQPILTVLRSGGRMRASIDPGSNYSGYFKAIQLSFATPTQGWVTVGDGYLMSTTDGGNSWTELLPGPQPHVIQPHGSVIQKQSKQISQ